MNLIRRIALIPIVALATVALPLQVNAGTIPVTDWVVHNTNGSITVTNANTNSPSFKAADVASDVMSLMAPFSAVTLANDGDFIKLTASLAIANRSGTGVNTLNTHLRLGLFDGPGAPVVAGDSPDYGFIAQYARRVVFLSAPLKTPHPLFQQPNGLALSAKRSRV